MSVLTLNVDEVMRTLSAESSNPFVVHDKEVDIVRFAINSGFADIVLDGQVALRVMYQRPGETEVRAKTLTYYDTDGLHNYYDWQLSQSDLTKDGSLMVALCILDISGGEVSEWHTTPCAVRVLSTIHTDDSDEGDDTITPTVKERVAVLETMIQRVASGSPIVVASMSAMTDTSQIYVLSTDRKWYYHNGTTWVSGGTYGAVATDTTLTQAGIPADAKATGDAINEIKADLKVTADGFYPVLFNANKNAYINQNNGKLEPYNGWMASDYIDCEGLTALYINAPVESIYGGFYSDKSEESYISRLHVGVGDNIVSVPHNAKYFRLSNTNAGLEATTLQLKEFSKITDLVNTNSVINAGLKDIGSYALGEYINASTGEFEASASYKRTGYIPISDYVDKVIYFTSNYRTPYCCFYNANKEKIIAFIIYVGETFVTIPDNAVYCAFSYSRYSGLVTMYDSTFSALKALGFSNVRDINLKNIDRADILTQMILKPLFLVYTDIHGYPDNLKRIASFYDKNIKPRVDYPICLGDMVRDQATEDISWLDSDFGKATLKVIGNHDVLVGGTLPGITSLEAYNKYIAPNVTSWGVTQPSNAATNGYNYYYKDVTYSGGTVRMIILDEYFYDETQHNWFVATLADANTNGYSVIVCQHQSNVWNNQAQYLNDKKAFATPGMGFDLYVTNAGYAGEYSTAAENRAMAVDTFIGNGGEFICWMSGHTHSDQCHTFEKTHGKQLSLVFSNASMSMTSSYRIYDYSADCFQYVAVDLIKKYVYVLRIGTAVDKWFHKNEFMCYDYANHTVVEYH